MALSLLPASLPVKAESGGLPPAAQNAANAPLMAQSGTAAPENALENWQYIDFGFQSLPGREAFTSDEQPLEGFEGTAMSQLYVGCMNKTKSQAGSYAVYGAMPRLSAQGATISGSGAAGYLDASPVSAPAAYPGLSGPAQVEGAQYRTLNTVSLDMGLNAGGPGGKREVICESILLTGKETAGQAGNTSWLCLRTLVNTQNGYVPKNTRYIKLANSDASVGSIDVRAAQGLNALAAGDYDGDGADELAVYVPLFIGPYIQLYDIGADGGIAEGAKIALSDLHMDPDCKESRLMLDRWYLPIVNLTTSSLARGQAGKDHLVVSACLPRSNAKNYKGRRQQPTFAVLQQNGGSLDCLFLDYLDYGAYYMRFPAAVQADVNGSGTEEIVVAGYADPWTDPDNQALAEKPFEKLCVNLLVYDETAQTYRMAYTTPMEYTPTGDVKKVMEGDSGYAMSEPVALAAAALSDTAASDCLFLEGAVLSFSAANGAKSNESEQMRLMGGNLTGIFEMRMDPQAVAVSHAVSGHFAGDRPRSEQIALVWNANYSNPGAVVDSSITWLWMENNTVTQHDTNRQYLKGRDADGSGTFLSLARVEDTEHRAAYQYTGKSYGWSAPNVLMALPAAPYWKELPYGNGVGAVTFSVSNTGGLPAGAGLNYSVGSTGSLTAMAGAGALGSEALAGFLTDLNSALAAGGALHDRLSAPSTQTFRVPGEQNHVLLYATPIVTYQYDVWLPSFTVTADTAKRFKDLTGSNTVKDEKGKVYAVGDTVPAGWYSYNIHVPYSPAFTLITMDQYNEVCAKHTSRTGKLDMSAYGFTVGDPTTYKSSFSGIPHYNSVMNMKSRPKDIGDNDVDNQIDFSASAGVEGGGTVGLEVNAAVQAKIEEQVQFLGSEKMELSGGFTQSTDGNINMHAGFTFDIGAGASVNHLPTGCGDYSYQTTMGVWPCVGHGALLTTGFIVEPKADVPPKPPQNPYVYETGMQKDGRAFVVLAWEQPAASDYRLAKEYEVFIKNTGAPAGEYRPLGIVGALEQNFMLVTDLDSDKTYDFAFQAISGSGSGHDGGKTRPLTVTTAKAATLSVDPATPADLYEEPNAQGIISCNFTVNASDSDSGNTIEYRWQKYEASEGYIGEWVDLGSATSTTAERLSIGDDGAKYRCVVSSRVYKPFLYSAGTQTVVSRVATMHVGTDPRFSVGLTAQTADGTELPRARGGAYFLPAGGKVTLKAEVTKTDVTDISDGTVSLFCRRDGGAETLIQGGLTPVNGVVTHEWAPAKTGGYDLIAVYTGPGSTISRSAPEAAPAEPTAGPTGEPTVAPTPTQAALEPTAIETAEPTPAPTDVPSAAPTGQPAADVTPPAAPGGETTADSASLNTQEIETLALSAMEGAPEPTESTPPGPTATTPEPSATTTSEPTTTPEPTATTMPQPTTAPEPTATPTETLAPTAAPEPWATTTSAPSAATTLEPKRDGTAAANSTLNANIAVSAPIAIHAGKIKDEGYLVRYELNGGTNSAGNPHAIGRSAAPTALAAPTRVGAAFEGWYDDAGFRQKIEYLDPMRIAKKLSGGSGPYALYAKWTPTEYRVTYELGGEANHPDNPEKYTLPGGAALREPSRNGYRFMGWYFEGSNPSADVDKTNPVSSLPLLDKKGGLVAAGVTLRAKWEAIEYPITYHTPYAAGKGPNPDTYTVESTVALESADYTGRYGYEGGGWYTDAGYKAPIAQIPAGTTGPLALYAKLSLTASPVYFWPLGGVYGGENPTYIQRGSTVGISLGNAERQGFDFKTWCERVKILDGALVADESGPTYGAFTPYSPPGGSLCDLYAAWVPANGQVGLHWLDPLDGQEICQNYGVMGQTIADPGITPHHYGYAFDGKWYKDKALTQQWDFDNDTVPANPANGFSLYAGLRETYCTVSFQPNGGPAVPAQRVQEGRAAAQPGVPLWRGLAVVGWYEDAALTALYDFSTEVQSNLTLYAKWGEKPGSAPSGGGAESTPAPGLLGRPKAPRPSFSGSAAPGSSPAAPGGAGASAPPAAGPQPGQGPVTPAPQTGGAAKGPWWLLGTLAVLALCAVLVLLWRRKRRR